jgi:hypothetical protein
MNHFRLWTFILGLIFFSCNDNPPISRTADQIEKNSADSISTDQNEIRDLIRLTLIWADSKNSINLHPVIMDRKDSVYIGFDLEKHKDNLNKLKSTGFFAAEFIDNYDQIILTLDKGLRDGTYEQWLVGDLPTFIFANDVDPWCECQDVPCDSPSPWGLVEIEPISLDKNKGILNWKWGGPLEQNSAPSWKEFRYDFRVIKEDGKWKIAYLQGFDFKESTRRDGQL